MACIALVLRRGRGSRALWLGLQWLPGRGWILLVIENKTVAGQKIPQVFIVAGPGRDFTNQIGADLLSHVALGNLNVLQLDLALQLLVRDAGHDSEGTESKANEAEDQCDNKLPHFHWERRRVVRRGYLLLVTREKAKAFF